MKLLTFFSYFRLDEAQSEAMKLKVENGKLIRKVDSIKNENQNITWIEQEKDSLKQTVAQMRATIDNLQKAQSKQVCFERHPLLHLALIFHSRSQRNFVLIKSRKS